MDQGKSYTWRTDEGVLLETGNVVRHQWFINGMNMIAANTNKTLNRVVIADGIDIVFRRCPFEVLDRHPDKDLLLFARDIPWNGSRGERNTRLR
eukprot:TRINITY_DN5868_c0_g1_i1.p2 TRINITY_DN5868_c0_g1~~TRINITY_DN5868_c0_g1_i1.p2  ORF type:complete len:94 (+),score=6.96 TRINITY_DN5868_c0_g1_i1:282-563(+)